MAPLLKIIWPSTGTRRAVAGAVACAAAVVQLTACSPTLDWRDVRLPAAGLTLLFPCKPQSQERVIGLAERDWSAALMVCDAGDLTFSALVLSPTTTDTTGSGASPAAALDALVQSAVQRWGPADGPAAAPAGLAIPAELGAIWARHRRGGTDGQVVMTQAVFMASGDRLVQISVHGAALQQAALENFFGQLRRLP
jgi:hypothetical protein